MDERGISSEKVPNDEELGEIKCRKQGVFKQFKRLKFVFYDRVTTNDEPWYSKNILNFILNLKKQIDYFKDTVYTKGRSKCLPLADGAGYKWFSS